MQKDYNFNKLTFEEMKEYIEKNAPTDKAWFKKEAMGTREIKDKNGNVTKTIKVYSHLKAKRAFCERYMPELIPVAQTKKENVTKILEEW
jgi:hypothetical protein